MDEWPDLNKINNIKKDMKMYQYKIMNKGFKLIIKLMQNKERN